MVIRGSIANNPPCRQDLYRNPNGGVKHLPTASSGKLYADTRFVAENGVVDTAAIRNVDELNSAAIEQATGATSFLLLTPTDSLSESCRNTRDRFHGVSLHDRGVLQISLNSDNIRRGSCRAGQYVCQSEYHADPVNSPCLLVTS